MGGNGIRKRRVTDGMAGEEGRPRVPLPPFPSPLALSLSVWYPLISASGKRGHLTAPAPVLSEVDHAWDRGPARAWLDAQVIPASPLLPSHRDSGIKIPPTQPSYPP